MSEDQLKRAGADVALWLRYSDSGVFFQRTCDAFKFVVRPPCSTIFGNHAQRYGTSRWTLTISLNESLPRQFDELIGQKCIRNPVRKLCAISGPT
jgi:hypothetical protein